jgi:2-polyprenyl-6-methoxyphenol hydroxylase-like FAD-dependent oxidoreductase
VAKRLGARRQLVDKLTFVCGHFTHNGTERRSTLTMLEAAKEGWWYTANLPNGRIVAAFATEAEFARSMALHTPRHWMLLLKQTKHVGRRLNNCTLDPFPLTVRVVAPFRLDRFSEERWLAVGDAAAAYDPISSLGIEKAFGSALDAAATIARAIECGGFLSSDYGEGIARAFNEYQANRDYFYALEQRWADASFWQNRRARSVPPTAARPPESAMN